MRNKIINIAKNELGYKEGAGNSNKYSKELYGKAQEWCNDFVVWCMRKAGIGKDIVPSFSYVPSTAEWFDKRGEYKNSEAFGGDYIPQPGDIILFDYNHNSTSDHIGLVEKVENGKVYTIEGNKNDMVKECVYNLDSRDIRAYCVPAYPVEEEPKEDEKKSNDVIAKEVIEGKWGVGQVRKKRLEEAGYNYNDIQTLVNEMLGYRAKTEYKTVTAKIGLNIREYASKEAKIIGTIPYGKQVEVLENDVTIANNLHWDKIKYGDIIGYVANAYLR